MNCPPDHTAGWPPGRKCHCTECHCDFSTPTNFDRHRLNGDCLAPADAGLVRNKRGIWIQLGETDFDERFNRQVTA